MNLHIQTAQQLNQRATQILIKEMGIVDTLRFLSQFQIDTGDYVQEKQTRFANKTAAEIFQEMK